MDSVTLARVLSIHCIIQGDVFKHFVTLPGYIFFLPWEETFWYILLPCQEEFFM
jgi:hypothetical protein